MNEAPISVLVVDDSKVAQLLLVHILESDPQILVAGTADSGRDALDFITVCRPDVVLMDIHMPEMDGFETARRIMETRPLPIVVCSAVTSPEDVATTFRVMEAGALACVAKPAGPEHPDYPQMATTIRQTVRLMSEVKVVRRWARTGAGPAKRPLPARRAEVLSVPPQTGVIGIGASTGGPQVLQDILSTLPKDFAVPILIVQHIARGFLPGLVEWLGQTSGFHVEIAANGVTTLPGRVYFAPDDLHMGIRGNRRIVLTNDAPIDGMRPAVAYLFRTLAEGYGPAAIGVLLTGMGKDGAKELKLMRDSGAVTVAQDRESSVVHGMPGEAIRLGAATHIWPADKIAEGLVAAVSHGSDRGES